jgi:hypothetical protein
MHRSGAPRTERSVEALMFARANPATGLPCLPLRVQLRLHAFGFPGAPEQSLVLASTATCAAPSRFNRAGTRQKSMSTKGHGAAG